MFTLPLSIAAVINATLCGFAAYGFGRLHSPKTAAVAGLAVMIGGILMARYFPAVAG